jgi:SPW repeat
MATNAPAIEQHPDLAALRYRDLAGTTLVGQAAGGLTFRTGLYAAISPWVVGFNGATNLAASNLVTGLPRWPYSASGSSPRPTVRGD